MPQSSPSLLSLCRQIPWGIAFAVALALVGAGLLAHAVRPGHAAPSDAIALRYVSVSGDGPQARAWYDGAPPAGTAVQDALDHFAKQGFRVKTSTRRMHVVSGEASVWSILLERGP